MYNATKYIGALLESLLAQTFRNFEVIIVDDGSTDNSVAVVESYRERFGGWLTLSRMKKNSGGPGAPTNKAIAHSRGKYILAADNDDLLTTNALEVLYTAAEHFGADVVDTTRYLSFVDKPPNPFPAPENLSVVGGLVNKPTFLPNDIGERIKIFCRDSIIVAGWTKLVRRDLLIENEISFQENVKASQDIMWTIELIHYAKRYLLIPPPLYIYRNRFDSVSHTERLGAASIDYRGALLAKGAEFLCKFFGEQKFFRENAQYAWLLLDWLERRYSKEFGRALLKVPPHEAQKVLSENFATEFAEHGDLIAYLCTSVNVSRLKEKFYVERLNAQAKHIAELEQRLASSTKG